MEGARRGGWWGPVLLGLLLCLGPRAGATTLTLAQFKQRNASLEAELLRRFESRHPGLAVRVRELPASSDLQHQQFTTWLAARDPSIDVYLIDVIWVAEFAAAGWIRPLDGQLPPERRRAWHPVPLRAATFKGRLYALPRFTETGLLYYRKDLLPAPPKTWRELIEAAGAHRMEGVAGYAFQGKQYEGLVVNFLELLWSAGGELVDDAGRVTLSSPEGVAALGFLVDLLHGARIAPPGTPTYTEQESLLEFQEGRALFHRNWAYAWALTQRPASKVRGKVGVAPLPAWAPGGQGVAALGGFHLAISAFSRHPEEAWRLIAYLASPEVQKAKAVEEGRPPTLTALYEDPEVLRANPHFARLRQALDRSRPRPSLPLYPRVSGILQVYLSRALVRAMEPKAALDAASREIQAFLGR